MKTPFANQLLLASAVIVLAACSSAQSQEAELQGAPNTAVVVQSFDAAEPQSPMPEEVPPPLIVPESVMPNVAPLRPEVQRARAPASCEIIVDHTSQGVRITPVVHADHTMSGGYSLVVTKTGASGSSDINQGGPFDAARGELVKLGASEFSLERDAHFRAVLTITEEGREVCRDVRS